MTDYLKRTSNYLDPTIASDFASVFDELSFWSSRFGRLLFDNIEIRGHLKILDLGFGTGFPLFELANAFGRTCQVTGLDPWTQAVERARVKQTIYELPNVTILEGDGAKQPFEDETFDLIVSNLGINNFDRPAKVLAECRRVARPGASLVMTTNIKGHYREFYEVYRTVLRELGKEGHMERLKENEDHRGTKESVCALLEAAGFPAARVIEDEFQMRFLDGGAMLRHSLVRFGFLDGWRSVVTPEEEEEVFALLEKRLNEASALQGELRMTVPMLYIEGKKAE